MDKDTSLIKSILFVVILVVFFFVARNKITSQKEEYDALDEKYTDLKYDHDQLQFKYDSLWGKYEKELYSDWLSENPDYLYTEIDDIYNKLLVPYFYLTSGPDESLDVTEESAKKYIVYVHDRLDEVRTLVR